MNTPDIKYFNRDFEQSKRALINYIKAYYPTTFKDFSPASPGMIFIQQVAYISDVLNYYIDKQVRQNFISRAQQKKSIYDNAQSAGYEIRPVIPAYCQLSIQCLVQSKLQSGKIVPNLQKAPIISPGLLVSSINNPGIIFRVQQIINFKDILSTDKIQPYFLQQQDQVQYFLLTKYVQSYAMYEQQFEYTTDNVVSKYLKITLPQKNIVKIISVSDESGNEWYEVPFLSQTLIIKPDELQTRDGVRLFKKFRTNKKYIKRLDYNDYTYIQFGINSQQLYLDQQILQNVYNIGSQNLFTDPSKFLYSTQYGLLPSPNTTLTIKYLVGLGRVANISTNQLTNIVDMTIINQTQLQQITLDSLYVNNQSAAIAGRDIETLEQIKINTIASINSQNRIVNEQDYLARIRRLPSEYGYISKSYVRRALTNNNINVYVLTYDMNKQLTQVPSIVKQNAGKYLQMFALMGDRITITDAYIINIGVEFTISTTTLYSKKQVLVNCLTKLKEYFKIQNIQINSYINLVQIRNIIMQIPGVSNLNTLNVVNKTGTTTVGTTTYTYSNVYYSIYNATQNQIIYPSIDPSIFQVKYPDYDIVGTVL